MAQPPRYERQTDFTMEDADRTDHDALNAELDGVAQTTDKIRENLAKIQRDDGGLANGIVTSDSMAPGLVDQIIDQASAKVDDKVQEAQSYAAEATNAANVAQSAESGALGYMNQASDYADAASASAQASDTARVASQTARDQAQSIRDSINFEQASFVSYLPEGTGAVPTDVQSKLREFVSVKDFGAVGDGVTDDTAAIQAAIAAEKPLFFPEGEYRITSALTSNQVKIYWRGERAVLKSEVLSGFVLTLGTDATPKYDLILERLQFEKTSGTNSCIYLYEQLNAKIDRCYFSDFEDYAIHAKSCDGLDITNCRIYDGSVKVENQMDGFAFMNNEVAASVNHPCLEIYGGYAQTIENNFFSWSQQEAIVLGYDSTRGDYSNAVTIQNNYLERLCQQDTSADPRPFIYVGAPYDQDGTAYSGALRASTISLSENYINADINNANLAKVAPVLFEYADSCEYVNNRAINFSGTNARIQMKYPARALYLGAGGQVNGLTGLKTAHQQAQYRAYTAYRGNYQFYCERHQITTDSSGAGNIILTGTTTKFGTSASKLIFTAVPEKAAIVFIDSISINTGASADGSDQAAFRVRVNSGPISSTINVMVIGWVKP